MNALQTFCEKRFQSAIRANGITVQEHLGPPGVQNPDRICIHRVCSRAKGFGIRSGDDGWNNLVIRDAEDILEMERTKEMDEITSKTQQITSPFTTSSLFSIPT